MSTLIVLFTAAAAIQWASWVVLALGHRSAVRLSSDSEAHEEPVTVVVAVRNGAASLPTLFESLRGQSLERFEVVVVNDHSTDDTPEVVQEEAARDSRFRLVQNPGLGKKEAVSAGIAASNNEVVALTDADCRPEPGWLAGISRRHAMRDDLIVVGYGPYDQRPGWLNRIVRYETLHTALLTSAAIGLGRPYMAVGRNLSYRRSMFGKVGGHAQSTDLLSGDDDLFVQAASEAGASVRYMAEPETFVYSTPPVTLRDWIRQKRRHLSAGRRYNLGSTVALGLFHVTALAAWIAPFVLGPTGLVVLLARLLPGQFVIWMCAKQLRERGIAPLFVPLDLALQLYLMVVAPYAWLRPPRKW